MMRRRLFQFAIIVSCVVCVAISGLWVRSHWATDKLDWRGTTGWRSVQSIGGSMHVSACVADWSNQPRDQFGWRYEPLGPGRPYNFIVFLSPEVGATSTNFEGAGFTWHTMRRPDGVRYLSASAPCWFLAALAGALPTGWLVERRIRRRRSRTKSGDSPLVAAAPPHSHELRDAA